MHCIGGLFLIKKGIEHFPVIKVFSLMQKRIEKSELLNLEQRYRASLINSLGGFKPVLLIGTRSISHQENLAIFSSFFHLGANPALIGFVVRPDVSRRHTLENIVSTGFFTMNQILPDMVEAAHHTSARYAEEFSEFEMAGLTPEYLQDFFAPSVSESLVKWGCKFVQRIDIELNGTCIVVGEIEWISFPEEIQQQDGFLDLEKLNTITCLGLDSYHTTTKVARLPYAKPKV